MDPVADALAGLSLLVSGWVGVSQWRGTRRQETTDRRLAAIEEDRRLEETAPEFDVAFNRRNGRAVVLLSLRRGPDLDRVDLEIVERPTVVRAVLFDEGFSEARGSISPLRLGEQRALELQVNEETGRGGPLRFRLTAHAGGQSWPVTTIETKATPSPKVIAPGGTLRGFRNGPLGP